MAINFLNSIDLNQLELLHAAMENQATDALAGTGVDGQLYYNTTDDDLKVWTGSAWSTIVTTGSGDAVESITAGDGIFKTGTASVPIISVAYTESSAGVLDNIIQKAPTGGTLSGTAEILVNTSLTGTYNAAKIALNTIPINYSAAATDNIDLGGFKASNLADPTGTQDAATKAYVDAATVGGLIYQGGYDASTNTPNLDTAISVQTAGSGSGLFSGIVATTTTGSGTGMTVYVETDAAGALQLARVVEGGTDYAVADTVVPTITGHSNQVIVVDSIPIDPINKGFTYTVTVAGYFYNELVGPGDVIIAESDTPTGGDDWTKVQNNIDLASATQVGIGNVVPGSSGTIEAPYVNGTATLDVVDSSAIQKGAVIVAGGDEISVVYSGATATVNLDKRSFTNTGPAATGTTYTIDAATHELGSDAASASIIMVQLVEVATGETVFADVARGTNGLITITFAESQAANTYRALLQKCNNY